MVQVTLPMKSPMKSIKSSLPMKSPVKSSDFFETAQAKKELDALERGNTGNSRARVQAALLQPGKEHARRLAFEDANQQ